MVLPDVSADIDIINNFMCVSNGESVGINTNATAIPNVSPDNEAISNNVVSGDSDVVVADKTDSTRTENPEKHAVLDACKCKEQCFIKVKEETRPSINKQFWKLFYNERKKWLYLKVKQIPKKRCMVEAGKESRCKFTHSYFLCTSISDELSVCKVFFLKTLGYSNDKVLTEMFRVTERRNISSKQ